MAVIDVRPSASLLHTHSLDKSLSKIVMSSNLRSGVALQPSFRFWCFRLKLERRHRVYASPFALLIVLTQHQNCSVQIGRQAGVL